MYLTMNPFTECLAEVFHIILENINFHISSLLWILPKEQPLADPHPNSNYNSTPSLQLNLQC